VGRRRIDWRSLLLSPWDLLPFPNTKETERAIEAAKALGHEIGHGIESVWNEATGEGESSEEGTQTQSSSECIDTLPPLRAGRRDYRAWAEHRSQCEACLRRKPSLKDDRLPMLAWPTGMYRPERGP